MWVAMEVAVNLKPGHERLMRCGGGPALIVALGLLVGNAASAAPPPPAGARSQVPLIYHNSRSFRIPFNIDPAERVRIKGVLLCVSEDLGRNWQPISRTTPDKPALAYRAPRDGEFWFAVQTVDDEGRYFPAKTAEVEPRMKVVVDTRPPTLVLESNGRKGSLASVRWEVKDELIDLESLVLEYQAMGARDWRQVPIRRSGLIGQETWDAGTADGIKVRATVADKAKNSKETLITLPDGTPSNPSLNAVDAQESAAPQPIGAFTSGESNGLPQFPSSPANSMEIGEPAGDTPPPTRRQAPAPAVDAGGNAFNPFNAPRAANPPAPEPSGVKTLLVSSPRFSLQYAVDDAAPSGPAQVELWITSDGGRSWSRRGEDPDRQSPFPVDLGAEGSFGLKIVALSAANLGDQPPVPGEVPQMMVEVDSTPPVVRLDPVQVGTGVNAGKIAIVWQASDLHLGPRSVTISVRPEGPNTAWVPIGPAVDNTGQYLWTLPPGTPPKFHVRVEVVDQAGNAGTAETPENQPVLIDRSRPKSRILGLDPSSIRSGQRTAGGPIR